MSYKNNVGSYRMYLIWRKVQNEFIQTLDLGDYKFLVYLSLSLAVKRVELISFSRPKQSLGQHDSADLQAAWDEVKRRRRWLSPNAPCHKKTQPQVLLRDFNVILSFREVKNTLEINYLRDYLSEYTRK